MASTLQQKKANRQKSIRQQAILSPLDLANYLCNGQMLQVNIHEAKTQLSKLIDRACRGEEVVIAKAGKPIVRLTAVEPRELGRQFGALRGKARVDERFFEPLPDEPQRALSKRTLAVASGRHLERSVVVLVVNRL